MKKIKVTVKSVAQANEIIEYWKDKSIELEVVVKKDLVVSNLESITLERKGGELILRLFNFETDIKAIVSDSYKLSFQEKPTIS